MLDRIQKLKNKLYKTTYKYPQAYRTSNLLDRLMVKMDHHLFDTQYFHGSLNQSEVGIRAWVGCRNKAFLLKKNNPDLWIQKTGFLH